MLIDTHAHLNFAHFNKDRGELIEKCLKDDIWMINVGTNYQSSKKAIEIAGKYPQGIYSAIGLHPINLDTGLMKARSESKDLEDGLEKEFDYGKYKELAKSKKVVAIGEVGLDYWYKPKAKGKRELFKQKQKELLFKELELAKEFDLPVIFHCRMAHNDLIEILFSQGMDKLNGVVHCFTGDWEQAEKYLEMGFYVGFNGIIFKLDLDDVIRKTPLDKILLETDCPYLTPPNCKDKRNNPMNIKYVAEKIAEIKNIDIEEIIEATFQNGKKLFKI